MPPHRTHRHSQALRLSDSILLSTWRDFASQFLESGTTDSSVNDQEKVLGNKQVSFSRAHALQRCSESRGLRNAKQYLLDLAQQGHTKSHANNGLPERYKRRFIIQEKNNATIFQAVDDVTQQSVILKVYDKRFWTADMEAKARREVDILQQALHPNVLELLNTFETRTSLVLVTEHCTHGDLVKDLVLKTSDDSSQVVPRLKQVIQAALHIHRLGYIHCAISPCSILLRRDGSMCLCDLFHALEVGSPAGHRAGVLSYMPPEMVSLATQEEIQGGALARMHHYPFGPAVDVWQIGCLAYEMLAGRSPFEFALPEHTAAAVLFAEISEWPPSISPRMQSLIGRCLQKEPERRPTLEKLLEHPALNSAFAIAVSAATTLGTFGKKVLRS